MRAEIISVGTELLLGQIVDTNAAHLSRALSEVGVSVFRRTTVGDNHERLLHALKTALADSDMVITIGGLGPTDDDITRETLAESLGDELRRDEEIAGKLKAFFRLRKVPLLESNLKQAMVPTHGRALENPNGTAPGLLFEKDGKIAFALPGPPNEFSPMLENHVIPYLREKTGGAAIRSRTLRICGMGESLVEDKVKDLMAGSNPTVAPYAKLGEVHLRVTAKADSVERAESMAVEMAGRVAERLGSSVYGFDEQTLESVIIDLLRERNRTLATAESCTGGMLAARITEVPGSSDVFPGGVVNYSNESKTDLVYVPAEVIEKHGAVSPEVAAALAEGARRRFNSDYGIGITGIAGPGGATPGKPVGLVFIGIADSVGTHVEVAHFAGSRHTIRYRSTQTALALLRSRIMESPAGVNS